MKSILLWFKNIRDFFRATYNELQRVSWPSRQHTIKLTAIVVGVSVGLGALLTSVDYGLSQLLKLLIK
jgi:preprotein translocase subunit SecE